MKNLIFSVLALGALLMVMPAKADHPIYTCIRKAGNDGSGNYDQVTRQYEEHRLPNGDIISVDINVNCLGSGYVGCSLVYNDIIQGIDFGNTPSGVHTACANQLDIANYAIQNGSYVGSSSETVTCTYADGSTHIFQILVTWSGSSATECTIVIDVTDL